MSIEPYRRMIDLLAEATLVVAGGGTVVAANEALEGRLGAARGSLEGAPLSGLAAGPPDEVRSYLRTCSRTNRPAIGSLRLRGPLGEEVRYRAEGALLRPGSGPDEALVLIRLFAREESSTRFLELNRRIEELRREVLRRRRVERELLEQRELLRVTLASIGDAVIATDTAGNVSFLNPVAEALTGWGASEASGRPLAEVFRIVNEDTRAPVDDPVAKALREGSVVSLANHTLLIARDGAESAIEDTAAPIREPGGEVQGAVLVFHDVGARRRLENQLRDRAEKLAENDRRKDEFLAMLAHELRNPLASIGGAAQFLGRAEAGADLGWAREVIERQVRHLARLIEDLLDVSRFTRGRIELRRETLDLAPVLAGAVEAVRPLVDERKQHFRASVAPGLLWLEGDPLRLEQVFVNLLTNAAKYTEAGGRIALDASLDGGEVVVRVEDSGVGIAPELLPVMFDLFTQGDRSIARSEGGLGIGLTLVRKLVQMHGGTVAARSEGLGRGSAFTVRLPAATAPTPASPETEEGPPRMARAGSRVLVVDDNLDTARGLAKLLKLLGHDVRTAHDGREAIEAARSHRPEVVLLDIGLPGMDGFEVARQLRASEACKDCLLIAVSGYGQDEDRRRSKEAGFDHHLVKPIDFDALISVIDRPNEFAP